MCSTLLEFSILFSFFKELLENHVLSSIEVRKTRVIIQIKLERSDGALRCNKPVTLLVQLMMYKLLDYSVHIKIKDLPIS